MAFLTGKYVADDFLMFRSVTVSNKESHDHLHTAVRAADEFNKPIQLGATSCRINLNINV